MSIFQKILSFFDPLFGKHLHIRDLHHFSEPLDIGVHSFIGYVTVEFHYLLTDRLVRTLIVFCAKDYKFFYLESGEIWHPPTIFFHALKEFAFFQDRKEIPLRREAFEQALREDA